MMISDTATLKDLQIEFNKEFPFLRIMFYSEPHEEGKGSPASQILDPNLTVGEVRTQGKSGWLPLKGAMKVGVFETMMAKEFGLNVQVFRKSYGDWLQTWATDIWTLQEQNNRGEIMGAW